MGRGCCHVPMSWENDTPSTPTVQGPNCQTNVLCLLLITAHLYPHFVRRQNKFLWMRQLKWPLDTPVNPISGSQNQRPGSLCCLVLAGHHQWSPGEICHAVAWCGMIQAADEGVGHLSITTEAPETDALQPNASQTTCKDSAHWQKTLHSSAHWFPFSACFPFLSILLIAECIIPVQAIVPQDVAHSMECPFHMAGRLRASGKKDCKGGQCRNIPTCNCCCNQ